MPLALFDLDDTLIDRRGAFTAWAEEFVAAHGLDEKALAYLDLADDRSSGPMGSFFADVRETFDLAEPADRLWAQYRRRLPELVTCDAGTVQALRRLRRSGWTIGIVTNGMTDNQSAKIRNVGLDDLVDGWAISAEAGVRKPDPEIFRIAAARCGTSLADGDWMIGDNLALDIAGGRAAGLRTIWLRRRPGRSADPAPDLIVSTVAEAVAALLERI